jgi:mannose/cellobiose epimerase-like protein (N-acyl-D-glucosamine 2-epimerase family)
MQRDMAVALRHMRAPEDGYILDDFDRQWRYRPRSRDGVEYVSVGGGIETAWVLMRLYLITGDEGYRTAALDLAQRMLAVGWDATYGGWFASVARLDGRPDPQKVWFVQAYGSFLLLNLYNLTHEERYLELFRRHADFWNQHFLDRQYGGDVISTDREGRLLDGTKGTSSKCSYHTMEHGLLNYLYLGLYAGGGPVDLYLCIAAAGPSLPYRVCPVEDPAVVLADVRVDGAPWTDWDAAGRWVRLPGGGEHRLRVTLRRGP